MRRLDELYSGNASVKAPWQSRETVGTFPHGERAHHDVPKEEIVPGCPVRT